MNFIKRLPGVEAGAILAISCLLARRIAIIACAFVAGCYFTAGPAWSQVTPTCGGEAGYATAGGSFYSNFAQSTPLATFGYQLPSVGASPTGGDLNSIYYSMFYSIAHATTIANATPPCQLEVVLVGTFPQTRYFLITDNDMHYANTQHLADFQIDPAEPNNVNPFTAEQVNPGRVPYMVPISLGYLPDASSGGGCYIMLAPT